MTARVRPMTVKRALQLAALALLEQQKTLNWEANVYERYGQLPTFKATWRRREALRQARAVIVAMVEVQPK